MKNPLFGTLNSPSPDKQPGRNPVWSPDAAGPSHPPASAQGMRRLGALQPWQLHPSASDADMAVAPAPGAGSAAAAAGRDRPEEMQFADAVARIMHGEMDAAGALITYAEVCRARAGELRDLATSQLQRAPRFMALSEAATELEAEAATWQLVWYLHGVPSADFPAGRGGDFVEGAGFAKTFRQHAADLLFKNVTLNRAARAVAWLEALAAQADVDPELGLARHDGVWAQTRNQLAPGAAARALGGRATGGAALVTQLDPDAPTRQQRRLAPDNVKDEERLMAVMWRLVRGGRVARALGVCEFVGQPWRAASLSGGGIHGPLPLGLAAEEADAADPGLDQAEALGAEVEGGTGTLRALWRWSCLQTAERAAAAADATGGGVHEAAVYGALSGNLARVLPACRSWEDAAWAYLRCWLDCRVDRELGVQVEAYGAALPADALAEAGAHAAATATIAEGLAVVQGRWPPARMHDALPRSFEEAVEAAGLQGGGAGGKGGSEGALRYRRVQTDLILDRIDSLVSEALVRWIIDGTGGGSPDADGPACPPGLMRFAAHLALALWTLGIADVPAAPPGAATAPAAVAAAFSPLHNLLQRLVQVYCVHLIDSGAHALVPMYACHLRSGLRRATVVLLMEQLVAGADMAGCRNAYVAGAAWFGAWQRGDVVPEEMAIMATKAVAKAQFESAGGPLLRAQALRWLCMDASTHTEAVRWANTLCREFCLGGAGGAAAASAMLSDVAPAAAGGGGLEALLASAEAAGALGQAAELRCWARYFELEAEFCGWEEVYAAALDEADAAGVDPGSGALADLAQQTLPLLEATTAFLQEGCLWWLADGSEGGDSRHTAVPPGEVAVVLGPEAGPNAPAAVREGREFPTFEAEEQRSGVAESLRQALQGAAAAGNVQGLAFQAGPAPEEGSVQLPGLMSVAVDCGEEEAPQAAAVTLLALAIKGALPAAHSGSQQQVGPFVVTNISASLAVSAALCRAVCTPRVALKAAALRQAVAAMGHVGDEGGQVVQLVAADEVAVLFSQRELQALLEAERLTITLHMRNCEAAAAAAGGMEAPDQQTGEAEG